MTKTTHPITNTSLNKTFHQSLQPIDRFLRWTDGVEPIVGICRSHAHQLIAKGLFPSPVKLVEGGRASAWQESKIREWIEGRIAASTPTDSAA